jgi:hypothetical protein
MKNKSRPKPIPTGAGRAMTCICRDCGKSYVGTKKSKACKKCQTQRHTTKIDEPDGGDG